MQNSRPNNKIKNQNIDYTTKKKWKLFSTTKKIVNIKLKMSNKFAFKGFTVLKMPIK